jgi:hypothetical protein
MHTESSPSQVGGLVEATHLITAIGFTERLLILDDIWTAAILDARSRTNAEADIEGLIALAGEISEALGEAPATAKRVRESLEQVEQVGRDQVLALIYQSNPQIGAAISALLDDHFPNLPPQDTFIAACRFVEAATGAEQEHMYEKRGPLEAGAISDPDLRPPYRCGITLIKVGAIWGLAAAGAVSVLGAPIVIGAGVLAAGVDVAEKWDKSGCPETIRQIVERFK